MIVEKYPAKCKALLPFLVARVVVACDSTGRSSKKSWVEENLHPTSPFFASRFWLNGWHKTLRSHVITATLECSCGCMMRASGISDVGMLSNMLHPTMDLVPKTVETLEALRQEVKDLRTDIVAARRALRDLGGVAFPASNNAHYVQEHELKFQLENMLIKFTDISGMC